LADKKKGFGDALLDLFVVREEGDAAKPGGSAAAGGSSDSAARDAAAPASDAAVVDDLIARYAKGDAAGKARSPRPPNPATTTSALIEPTPAASASGPAAATASSSPTAAAPAAAPAKAASPPVAEPALPVPQIEIDVGAVLRKAGLSPDDQDRVEKTLNLLHTLPGDTPVALKRQIVGASLQAFGISVDQIVESALLQQGAFLRHQDEGEKQTQAQLQDSSRRLSELEKEAARIKQQMSEQRAQQQGLVFAVSRQKARLQGILEFFGTEAVERVQKSSVKLRSGRPQAPGTKD
jgi:hypothetical protein